MQHISPFALCHWTITYNYIIASRCQPTVLMDRYSCILLNTFRHIICSTQTTTRVILRDSMLQNRLKGRPLVHNLKSILSLNMPEPFTFSCLNDVKDFPYILPISVFTFVFTLSIGFSLGTSYQMLQCSGPSVCTT